MTRRADGLCVIHAPPVSAAASGDRIQLLAQGRALATLTTREAIDLADNIIDLIENTTEAT